MSIAHPPIATYRLQFNREFTFADTMSIVEYLHELGISHIYASPFLRARAGSPHGYDIVDHGAFNPEVGDAGLFERLVARLRKNGMGLIVDVVPNHMGVGGSDNEWWLDVLENGESSACADWFDIDWRPANPGLRNRLLLPFLGDHYGRVLENGELVPSFDDGRTGFQVAYYEHRFPLDPSTWPEIIGGEGTARDGLPPGVASEIDALVADLQALPARTVSDPEGRRLRREQVRACKERLAGLCACHPSLPDWLNARAASFQGTPDDVASFDRLHCLLESQAYRLSYWQVATDEINYRRFFDINELAGIRVERPDVFEATHRLVARMVRSGQIDGLRIDHPDGLYDPCGYFQALQRLAGDGSSLYLLVEKILANYERLPTDWPVAGTTGYDYAALLNGLFVWPGSERRINRLYRRFTGLGTDFDELLYERKKLIIRSTLSGELTMLGNLLYRIAQADRHTRDFTFHGLLHAITETVACFPVYRTYVSPTSVGADDRRYVQWAIARAKKRSPAADTAIFDFLCDALLLQHHGGEDQETRERVARFALRFQQYTAPVMAKGMEDTAFYIYNRMTSLNDVGFDPRIYGNSTTAFHLENRQRQADWQLAMIGTSTHDSKRSEDVRARINVLSEVPEDWQRHLGRWARINRTRKRIVDDKYAPSRNDEYLIYQTMVGTWPLEALTPALLEAYRARLEAFMLKAVREAKVHSSWINPNEAYEEGLGHFIRAILNEPGRNAFLADFTAFHATIVRFGLLNALSQTLLKLASPGVPDFYQGSELWNFSLVDPDNRRAVDYALRRDILADLKARAGDPQGLARELAEHIEDGRIKLYVTHRALQLRCRYPEVFREGDYAGLEAHGEFAEHVCAFARRKGERIIVAAAARWFARMAARTAAPAAPEDAWEDTWIELPAETGVLEDVFTGARITPQRIDERTAVRAADLFSDLPVALLGTLP